MIEQGPFSVLLCDDSVAMRTAVRTLMEADERFEVVGEASDGVEAVERAAELRPNLVLLDVTMPRQSGIEALPSVIEESPHSMVVLLTAFSREAIEASTAMQLDSLRGVYYMDKTSDGEELLDSLAAVATASLSTSASRGTARAGRGRFGYGEQPRRLMEAMSRNRRVALAVAATLVLSAGAATLAIGAAQSARGPCVTARPPLLSKNTLYGRASQKCSGAGRMYTFLQGRYGKDSHAYTLASGSTTGTFLQIGAARCAFNGKWHVWTLATRGLVTDTSKVRNYSCKTKSPTIRKPV